MKGSEHGADPYGSVVRDEIESIAHTTLARGGAVTMVYDDEDGKTQVRWWNDAGDQHAVVALAQLSDGAAQVARTEILGRL